LIPAQLPLRIVTPRGGRFDNFHAGPNAAAVTALEDFVAASGARALYLCGESGTGKSHLLEAVCAACAARGLESVDVGLSADRHAPGLLAGLSDLDVVCLDDIDRVAGDAQWERALFNLYEEALASGVGLLYAGRSRPASTGFQLPDLVSRLCAAVGFRLTALDDEGCGRALRLRARERGIEFPAEVSRYLLRHERRDMGSLIALLDRLDVGSLAAQRRITVPFVRELLGPADRS